MATTGASFGPDWGTPVVLVKSAGEANLPSTITAYIASTPLQNGKFYRSLYMPALSAAPVVLTGTTTMYDIPDNSLMGKGRLLPGSTGEVETLVKQAAGGAFSAAATDYAFLTKKGQLQIVTTASTALIEGNTYSNYYVY